VNNCFAIEQLFSKAVAKAEHLLLLVLPSMHEGFRLHVSTFK